MTLLLAMLLSADAPDYERDVKPILAAHCVACHNAEDANSGYRLDTFAHLTKPIDDEFALQNGPSLIPGDAKASRLYRLMAGLDEPRMPPAEDAPPVPAEQLKIVRDWIDAGAKGPDGEETMIATLVVPELPPAAEPYVLTAAAGRNGVRYFGAFRTVEAKRGVDGLWQTYGLPGKINDIAFGPRGKTVFVGTGVAGLSGTVVGLDAETGEETFRADAHRDAVQAVAASKDFVATAAYDRTIVLHDRKTGRPVRTLKGHNGAVYDLAFSPDGSLLLSGSGDETVKVWSAATGERQDTMSQPEGEVYAVAFSPDGRHAYAASADNRVRKWRIDSRGRAAINPLEVARFAHEGPVTAMAVTASHVVTASADRTVKAWDAETMALLQAWPDQPHEVTSVAVEEDRIFVARTRSVDEYPLPAKVTDGPAETGGPEPVFVSGREETAYEEADAPDVLAVPARMTGTITEPGEADEFAFDAKAGEQWVIEVLAARGSVKDKSPLDSVVEVLDGDGDRVLRTRLQAVRDSYFTFRGKNGTQSNDFRVFNWREIELGQLFYANGEVVRMWLYPDGPDSGFWVWPGQGTRHSLFDTTGVAHALGDPAYVVRELPAGAEPEANGLPTFPVYYRNDDESTGRHGRDSVLHFTPPADGRYRVRVTDARGYGGPYYAYELLVRPRVPDFSATLTRDFKKDLIRGAAREWGVKVVRKDEFAGPVAVRVEGLPAGYSVPPQITVEPEQVETLFPLSVAENAEPLTDEQRKAVRIVATAETEDGRSIEHAVGGEPPLKLAQGKAKIGVFVEAPEVDGVPTLTVRAGETVNLKLRVDRREFKDRITFGKNDAGRNLPWAVFVDNVGLNGLMLTPAESERTFFVTAAPVAVPQERWFHVLAQVQGNLCSNSVRVRVLPAGDAVTAK